VQKRGKSGLRQLLTFLGLFIIVLGVGLRKSPTAVARRFGSPSRTRVVARERSTSPMPKQRSSGDGRLRAAAAQEFKLDSRRSKRYTRPRPDLPLELRAESGLSVVKNGLEFGRWDDAITNVSSSKLRFFTSSTVVGIFGSTISASDPAKSLAEKCL
jgi:hypothetical protein